MAFFETYVVPTAIIVAQILAIVVPLLVAVAMGMSAGMRPPGR